MPYHSIEVARPFDVVARQILALDEAWWEHAARNATRRVAADRGTSPDDLAGAVRVRVGWPRTEAERLWLRLEWEASGSVAPRALRGALDVRKISLEETRIAVRMAVVGEPAGPDDREPIRVARAAGLVTLSFLQQVFWFLEAVSRYEMAGPRESGTTGARGGRGTCRGPSPGTASRAGG